MTQIQNKYIALLPAAGVGQRFGAKTPKQYVYLAQKPVLQHTLDIFAQNSRIEHIAIIISANDDYFAKMIRLPENAAVYRVGGETRAQTVFNGVKTLLQHEIAHDEDWILVHDAARCCLPQAALMRLLDANVGEAGGLLAIPVSDTLKRQNEQQCVEKTVSRAALWQAQTPQMFQAALLQRAMQTGDLAEMTDEASAIERLGLQPLLVEGDSRNFKLTHPEDAFLAELLLTQDKTGFRPHEISCE